MSVSPTHPGFDLAAAALQEVQDAGFQPDFAPECLAQLAAILQTFAALAPGAPLPNAPDQPADLRHLPWSSIDNDTSRDLDQIERAETVPGGVRLHIAVADVASLVAQGSPLDRHAAAQTQTIYTAARNFPMLPLPLSTGITSLNPDGDRLAIILSFTVDAHGTLTEEHLSHAWVRNRAQLAYSVVGPWLQSAATASTPPPLPPPMAAIEAQESSHPIASQPNASQPDASQPDASLPPGWLAAQLHLQDQAAQYLCQARRRAGALEFKRAEADPVVIDGQVVDLQEVTENRAMNLIEELMVAANGVMARALRAAGRSALQRVVRTPQRWDRIAALALERGTPLPDLPDPVALNTFLQQQHTTDEAHYPELAVAVIKLLGAGEYIPMRPDDDPTGHFGLAARDYTHSTAPNRRYADLVTERILLAALAGQPAPFSDEELTSIATQCNQAGKAIRKIDRAMQKRVAAVALSSSVGRHFQGVVTGASPKGVYVRVFTPPFEGRIVQGATGLDVGACVEVRLLHTDPARAFIDLAAVATHACDPA